MPRSTQGTRWVFTLNNPTQAEKDNVVQLGGSDRIKYLVVGRERGESGTPHLQGFVIFTSTVTFSRVARLLPRAHIEHARGTSSQAGEYCKKDGDFDEYGEAPVGNTRNSVLDNLYEWGDAFIAEHGRAPTSPEIAREHPTAYVRYPRVVRLFENRTPVPELRQGEPQLWQSELAGELEEEADDRSVIFYVDPEGGKGKSWFQAWYMSNNEETTQVLSAAKRDDVAHNIQKTKTHFFFNVPRGGMEYFPYSILEQLKDRMVFSPKYNSCMKFLAKTPHVLVFCNEMPDMNKMSIDRYVIRENYNTE